MIRVLGRNNSINVQKVMWCSAELKLIVQRENIGGAFAGNHTPDYLNKNPNGTIPTLIHDNFVIWESNSIVRYLCEYTGASPWFPNTITKRGEANQWMDWYLTTMHPHMTTIFWQLIRTPLREQNLYAINHAVAEATELWSILNNHLENREYILGKNISMADIPLGCAAYRWLHLEINRPDFLHINRWWKNKILTYICR